MSATRKMYIIKYSLVVDPIQGHPMLALKPTTLYDCGKHMDYATIIPFPAKHNFLIGLKVTEGEDAKRNCIVFVGLGVPAGLAEYRAENSVGSTTAADET